MLHLRRNRDDTRTPPARAQHAPNAAPAALDAADNRQDHGSHRHRVAGDDRGWGDRYAGGGGLPLVGAALGLFALNACPTPVSAGRRARGATPNGVYPPSCRCATAFGRPLFTLLQHPQERIMTLDERDEGDYRIYAGALEGVQGDGYIAAVVVSRVRNTDRAPREAFRDEALACGNR